MTSQMLPFIQDLNGIVHKYLIERRCDNRINLSTAINSGSFIGDYRDIFVDLDSFWVAAKYGLLQVILWLCQNKDDYVTMIVKSNYSFSIEAAAAAGHFNIVKWLCSKSNYLLFNSCRKLPNLGDAIINAAGNGHFEIVKFLCRRTNNYTMHAMDSAAVNGHLRIVKWLYYNSERGRTYSCAAGAAENGHLDVVKWLVNIRKERCGTHSIDLAAANGHFEVVKWLYLYQNDGFTDYAIKHAYKNGHPDIAKWLESSTRFTRVSGQQQWILSQN